MDTTFHPRMGYRPDDDPSRYARIPPSVGTLTPPLDGFQQWKAPLVVQNYQDCVENALATRMQARIVMQRTPDQRDALPLPKRPNRRFMYYKYLEETGQLGLDPGSQPWDVIESVQKHGWCAEEDWEYPEPDEHGQYPRFDEEHAPPIAAIRAANGQRDDSQARGTALKAHLLAEGSRLEMQQALFAELGVLKPFALDTRFVSPGGIPDDPDYVWEFDESSPIRGWHMLAVEAYHPEKGILVPNTWGLTFGCQGYVWISWRTAMSTRYSLPAIALDWVRQTTQEIAEALA